MKAQNDGTQSISTVVFSLFIISLLFFIKNQENPPTDKPVLTAYSRLSGQEWFFLNINKGLILKVIQVRGEGRTQPEDQTVQLTPC